LGNLSKLSFLSLPDNKSLVSLPSSLSKLDRLTMINLRGSNPNVQIPQNLKDVMEDNGDMFYTVL
jgi:Leucine-rich repeat (LRR) protein